MQGAFDSSYLAANLDYLRYTGSLQKAWTEGV